MKEYDIILIGTGQATGTILSPLLKKGLEVAVIEHDKVGGSCVNWGCTPTKALVKSAKVARTVQTSSEFGVICTSYRVDFPLVLKRVNEMRENGESGFREWLKKDTHFYEGTASFIDEHTIHISGQNPTNIKGKTIIIHTGAKASIPPIKGISEVPYLTNREIFSLKSLPKHLIIIGGSYISLEFSQMFARFGSLVTILERGNRLIQREDEDISEIAKNVLEDEEIDVLLNCDVIEIEKSGDEIIVHYNQNGKTKKIKGTHLLVATGRNPQTASLNLENTQIELDERGYIKTNEYGQTHHSHIYALGDVNGKGAFTHTSVNDGLVFLDHYIHKGELTISQRIPTYALYIDPPIARVGINEQQALKEKRNVLVAHMEMSQVSRAKEKGETKGRMKIVVDALTKELIGATIFGVGGDEVIGMLDLMSSSHLPYTVLQQTVIPHPTVGELIPFMLDSLHPL
ncbi:MAG: mercuric reductase [Spirochaetia bacterium]|nr:mercuric reductase [Spirochaetia bacterium]